MIILIFRSEVAKRLDKKCYGLIFGFNTFIAVCINTIIIYGVIQGHFIKINIAQQVKYKYNITVRLGYFLVTFITIYYYTFFLLMIPNLIILNNIELY